MDEIGSAIFFIAVMVFIFGVYITSQNADATNQCHDNSQKEKIVEYTVPLINYDVFQCVEK